jgi:hypothetical protein
MREVLILFNNQWIELESLYQEIKSLITHIDLFLILSLFVIAYIFHQNIKDFLIIRVRLFHNCVENDTEFVTF